MYLNNHEELLQTAKESRNIMKTIDNRREIEGRVERKRKTRKEQGQLMVTR